MAVQYDYIEEILPQEIAFVSTQELVDMYPDLTPKEREYKIVKEKGCCFPDAGRKNAYQWRAS